MRKNSGKGAIFYGYKTQTLFEQRGFKINRLFKSPLLMLTVPAKITEYWHGPTLNSFAHASEK